MASPLYPQGKIFQNANWMLQNSPSLPNISLLPNVPNISEGKKRSDRQLIDLIRLLGRG
jgi:hypothetical protein